MKALLASGTYWMYVTAGLGFAFLLGQILAWRNLAAQGLFLATNPSSSFFYVFTALHGVHLLGGIGGLIYVLRKLVRTNGSADSTIIIIGVVDRDLRAGWKPILVGDCKAALVQTANNVSGVMRWSRTRSASSRASSAWWWKRDATDRPRCWRAGPFRNRASHKQ